MGKNFKFLIFIVLIVFSIFLFNKNDFRGNEVLDNYYKIKYDDNYNLVEEINEPIVTQLKNEYGNNDIVGTITINGTDIDTMLVQTDNNTYYLNHSYDLSVNEMGSIFIDYRNNLDDKKLLIYGHNFRYRDGAFHQLTNYKDKSFYDSYPYIEITLNEEVNKYQIFSVMIEKPQNRYLHTMLNFVDEASYKNHLDWLKENSIYETNIEVSKNDYIITLQTCYYNPVGSYFIINAKKI